MTDSSDTASNKRLPIIPLRNTVLYPHVVLPVDIGRTKSLAVAELAQQQDQLHIVFITQTLAEVEDPGQTDLFSTGVEAEVIKVIKVTGERATMVVRGLRRVRLVSIDSNERILWGIFEPLEETGLDEIEAEGLAMSVRESAKQLISVSPTIPDEAGQQVDQLRNPSELADLLASHLDGTVGEKMELLNMLHIPDRLRETLKRIYRALEAHKVKESIDSHVRAEMGKHQREAMLRQRMRAIQEELGGTDEDDSLSEFEELIKNAGMPAETETVARKQLQRLTQIPTMSPEHTVTRTYLEWLVELPWNKFSDDILDLDRARHILDEDHYGLEKVKKRIVEYLAVRKLKPDKKGPILCLVGPPGVGKTSTGRSLARAMGREFIRASLGGVRDEAEIRGHRRTYVGAMPGRILQGLKRAGTRNPVFVLDEIDKLGMDFRGDPSSALLEVLDPEQNNNFSDHFLEVPFDLSRVFFIATANEIDPIPPALKDRLEIIEIPGYTRQEKLHIAKTHLIPKQIVEHGLTTEQFQVQDEAILEVADSYTREAGVRNLERELSSLCRGVAVHVASNQTPPATISPDLLANYLGPIKFFPEVAERTQIPGVATGLAWTPVGGEILFVEATQMPGKGKLILTGHLGDVMKESAQAALTYARARAEHLGLPEDFFSSVDIHVHVPAGSTKKDGPSAGVTMVTALVSLLSNRCVLDDIAMTGEISLRGLVLPVGGVKEKVLAAHRAGLKRVLLPERNKKDLIDIPKEIQSEMQLIFVSNIDEVIKLALEPAKDQPLVINMSTLPGSDNSAAHNPLPC